MDRIKRKRHPYLYVCGIIYIIAIWINLITFNIFNTIETGGIYFDPLFELVPSVMMGKA